MGTGKSTPRIALMTVANSVSADVVDRFVWGAKHSEQNIPFDIYIGDHKDETQKFYKTVILNDILRNILDKYDVLVQTDIDMLIPPNLIKRTLQFCSLRNNCFHCCFHHLNLKEIPNMKYKHINWNEIKKKKVISASGSWNGMNRDLWKKSGGFSEVIFNLGGPDSEFYMRTRSQGIVWTVVNTFPLCHISHKRRSPQRRGRKNLSLARKYPKSYNWLRHRNPKVCGTNIKVITSRGNDA